MAKEASAMMPVVAQPRRRADSTDGELSHLGAPAADPHHRSHHWHRHESVDHCAPEQRLDRIEAGKVDANTQDHCRGDHTIKADGLPGLVVQAALPTLRLAECVGRRTGKDGDREKTCSDDPQAEKSEGKRRRPMGLSAAAASAAVPMTLPWACKVEAVLTMMAIATIFETAMPTSVSKRILWNSALGPPQDLA